MAQRGTKGEGSIFQRCEARYGCPPVETVTDEEGKTKKVRPKHDCSGRWFGVVDLTVPGSGRTRRTVSAKTKQEVRVKLRGLKKRTAAGAVNDGSQTVEAWLTYWLDEVADVRASTEKTYRGYVKNWIAPHLGKRRLSTLSPEDVRGLMRTMEKAGKSPATRKQVLAILSKALVVAAREGKVERNVCDTVARPSLAGQERHGVLTLEQVATLLPHALAHPRAARWTAAFVLGLRQGEALGLAWEDVHMDDDAEPYMHIRQAQQSGTTELGPVKSRASDRLVPIVSPVYEALKAQRDRDGSDGLVWGPMPSWQDYDEWQALLVKAGIPAVPLHAARATAASVLDAMGATPRQVADILGQAQVDVGQKHYVHSQPADLRAALTRAGRAMLDAG